MRKFRRLLRQGCLAFGIWHLVMAASAADAGLDSLVKFLDEARDGQVQLDVLRGMSEALKGKRDVSMPAGWEAVEKRLSASDDQQLRLLTQSLGLTFGSKTALGQLRAVAQDRNADANARRSALESLLTSRDEGVPAMLQGLLSDPTLRGPAIRGLARFEAAGSAEAVIKIYPELNAAEKRDALNMLSSRATTAQPLLAAAASGMVPKKDLTADLIRQLRNLKSAEVDKGLQEVWGAFREATADKKQEIEKFTKIYRAGGSQPGDAVRGRAVYARTCQQCHVLFDVGGNVGPDITGSARADLQYILETIVDPNAVIPHDYRSTTVSTKDDRIITGIVKKDEAQSLTIATANETLTIPKSDVESVQVSEISMMPEGLLAHLNEQEVRDLIYYLGRPGQVPLLATADTVGYFFNGKDLAGWDGDTKLWKVENGEIVGTSRTGLKHNEFLKSQMVFGDFRLLCEVKLTPNHENSGIQFRSEPLPNGEVRGYQADVGAGWWGKLYEEEGRALLWDKSGESNVKADEWNTYEILAIGDKIQTAINGKPCVDLNDPKGAKQGIFAFQLHSGGPMKVRYKNFQVEVNPKAGLKTVR
ncbi:MAG TPA: family 16 glycoside hydrolase [Verrucomicrobiae bacterium]